MHVLIDRGVPMSQTLNFINNQIYPHILRGRGLYNHVLLYDKNKEGTLHIKCTLLILFCSISQKRT